MSKHDIAKMGCRLLSLYALFDALRLVDYPLGMLFQWSMDLPRLPRLDVTLLVTSVPLILALIAAWILWSGADRIAARITRDMAEHAPSPTQGDLIFWQTVFFSAAGVFILFTGLSSLPVTLARSFYQSATGPSVAHDSRWWSKLTSDLLYIGLGSWLLFGNRGIVILLGRLRTAGLAMPEKPETPSDVR